MYSNTKTAPAGELSAERMMCTVRIIMTSPTLRQAALEYRPHAVNVELAKRMGVDSRGPQAAAGVRGVGVDHHDRARRSRRARSDWRQLGVDDIVPRLEATFAEFTGLIAGARAAGLSIWPPPRGRGLLEWDYLL